MWNSSKLTFSIAARVPKAITTSMMKRMPRPWQALTRAIRSVLDVGEALPLGKAEVVVRGEVVAGGVAPLALHEAVGERQQLQGVDAELLQVAAAWPQGGGAGEIRRLGVRVDQGEHVAEGADPDLRVAARR